MEREIVMGGIGGQGVQLATKLLAQALNAEAKHVMHFAAFGGTMRGGNVECTVVAGTEALVAPPIIPSAWMAVAMHPNVVPVVRPKTRVGGLFVVNGGVVTGEGAPEGVALVAIPAAKLAEETGNLQGAAMAMLAAVSEATGLVSVERLAGALETLTPSYRRGTIPKNVAVMEAGAAYAREHLASLGAAAWAPALV